MPDSKVERTAPIARTLKLNGYATVQFCKCHEVPGWQRAEQTAVETC
jgi:hypothetical protein